MWVCKYCETENWDNAISCACCGKPKVQTQQSNAQNRTCPKCHSSINGSAAYCQFCGARLLLSDPHIRKFKWSYLAAALLVVIVAVFSVYKFANTSLSSSDTPDTLTENLTSSGNGVYSSATKFVDICAGYGVTVGLRADGTVEALFGDDYTFSSDYDCAAEVEKWSDIVAIATTSSNTVGLKSDGTVLAIGSNDNGQCDVAGWTNIKAIALGYYQTIGLKDDGTIVIAGSAPYGDPNDISYIDSWTNVKELVVGNCTDGTFIQALREDGVSYAEIHEGSSSYVNRNAWTDIVYMDSSGWLTLGVKSNGTVVAGGYAYDYSYIKDDISSWTNIDKVYAGDCRAIAIKKDGTVAAAGYDPNNQFAELKSWDNIRDIVSTGHYIIGIKNDGSIVTSCDSEDYSSTLDSAIEEVGKWTNIQKIVLSNRYIVGLKTDGTLVVTGDNEYGQQAIRAWSVADNSSQPAATSESFDSNVPNIIASRDYRHALATGEEHTVALKKDGTVVATGYCEDGRCDVSSWRNIISVAAGGCYSVGLKADGTVVYAGYQDELSKELSTWRDIVAISACDEFTVGLKSDGTVVCTNYDEFQSELSEWDNIASISAAGHLVVGLRADGRVVTTNYIDLQSGLPSLDLSNWINIIDVSTDGDCVLGLKSDGTVISSKENTWVGQENITDIFSGGIWQAVIKADGTSIVFGGRVDAESNSWTNLIEVSASTYHIVGLRADGTVVADGHGDWGECNVSDWRNIGLPN